MALLSVPFLFGEVSISVCERPFNGWLLSRKRLSDVKYL